MRKIIVFLLFPQFCLASTLSDRVHAVMTRYINSRSANVTFNQDFKQQKQLDNIDFKECRKTGVTCKVVLTDDIQVTEPKGSKDKFISAFIRVQRGKVVLAPRSGCYFMKINGSKVELLTYLSHCEEP